MLSTTSPFARAFAAAAVLGALAVANPVAAKTPAPSSSSSMKMEDSDNARAGASKKMPSPEEMAQRVETRIQNLHDKLKITSDEESRWNDVAQAMRDSENTTHQY